jgi:hypothetical protein
VTVTAPSVDTYGAALQSQIATVQALVNATSNSKVVYPQYVAFLNLLQVELVCHFMETGWLNAGTNILATYSPAAWDAVGQKMLIRVAFLQNLYNTAPAPPVGNANGYGDSGWVTVAQNYFQQLYAEQTKLVMHLMDIYNPSAATMLANLTGVQTNPAGIAYQYVFNSVGFTDAWIDE